MRLSPQSAKKDFMSFNFPALYACTSRYWIRDTYRTQRIQSLQHLLHVIMAYNAYNHPSCKIYLPLRQEKVKRQQRRRSTCQSGLSGS